jgi:hypothetical protein
VRRALEEIFTRSEYQWVDRPSLDAWALDRWHLLQRWLDRVAVDNPALYTAVLTGLTLLLAGLLAHLAYVLVRVLRTPTAATDGLAAARAPVPTLPSARATADELARAGRYGDALGYRFLALLLELQGRRALTFDPAKTPAEYVGVARLDAGGRASLETLVARLYRHHFGAVPCDGRAYHEFGTAAEDVVRHVAPG